LAGSGSAGFGLKGSTVAKINTCNRPTTPMSVSSFVQVCSVSFSVNPLIRCTTQKPLSFIHESGNAPKPITRQK